MLNKKYSSSGKFPKRASHQNQVQQTGQCPASTWYLSVNIPIKHSSKNQFPLMLTPMPLNFPQTQFCHSIGRTTQYFGRILGAPTRGLLLTENSCKFPAFNEVKFLYNLHEKLSQVNNSIYIITHILLSRGEKKKRKKYTLKKGIAKDSKFHPPLLSFTAQVCENCTNNKSKYVGMYKNTRTH